MKQRDDKLTNQVENSICIYQSDSTRVRLLTNRDTRILWVLVRSRNKTVGQRIPIFAYYKHDGIRVWGYSVTLRQWNISQHNNIYGKNWTDMLKKRRFGGFRGKQGKLNGTSMKPLFPRSFLAFDHIIMRVLSVMTDGAET